MRWFYKDVAPTGAFVPDEVLHVLQHEGRRAVVVDDFRQPEEAVSLFLILEAVLAPEAEFLGDARDAEGLAGKAGAEDVVGGNVGVGHRVDVAVRRLAEVGGVGLLAEPVPVAGEDAARPRPLERKAEATDAAEEVNEFEWLRW